MIDYQTKLESIKILEANTVVVGDCWIFPGPKYNSGYACVYVPKLGKQLGAHRLSAAIFLNLDLDSKKEYALHQDKLCSRKDCWNPMHLRVGTATDNMQEFAKTGKPGRYNREKMKCKRGHELSGDNLRLESGRRRCKACHKIAVEKNRYGQ